MEQENEKISELESKCNLSILFLEAIWEDLKESNLTNKQFCLDWLDKLNEISIRN